MTNYATAVDLLPAWTKYVVTDPSGHDPLALSRVAQMVTDWLMPGIITQTNRARYYALYCWILWHIKEEEQVKTEAEFASAFQRREAVMAAATILQQKKASPVGVRTVRRRLNQAHEAGRFNAAFRVLPSNKLGGFGQNYKGCLYRLGLTHRPGAFDEVTDAGADLARVVHASLESTPYLAGRDFVEPSISMGVLERSAERLSIDALVLPFARYERRKLVEMFFQVEERSSDVPLFRRHSLAHILHGLGAYQAAGMLVLEKSLAQQLLYGPAYYDLLVSSDGKTRPAPCPDPLRECRAYWRQFCLQQYLTQALEGLLVAVLEVVDQRGQGRTLDEVTSELLEEDFARYLRAAVAAPVPTPAELMGRIGARGPGRGEFTAMPPRVRPYHNALSEASLCAREAGSPPEIAARSCLLLAILYSRWRHERQDLAYKEVMSKAGEDLATAAVLEHLDPWLDPRTSWESSLRELLSVLIVGQHDRVMYNKGRLESCWLEVNGGRILHHQGYEAYFRSSRHEQALNILVDLGLVQRAKGRLSLTMAGKELLHETLGDDS